MKEALKLALEALDGLSEPHDVLKAQAALRQALEQSTEQEPVAWESILGAVARGWCYKENANKTMDSELAVAIAKEVQALFTQPQEAAPRKPLTDEDLKKNWYAMQNIMGWYSFQEIARAIEAAHGITGEK